ncbi:hypothetical protein [Krasilnikovia sp. MM14-A1259]|uniref:hypothetical protein n=1 Tax=Krasilnikovia sp. MM14-A1259 TaxID=3373539 RepID=UPI0037FF2970
MIRTLVRAWLTVGRLEYGVLLAGGLLGLVAKHAGASKWIVAAAFVGMVLGVRWARNRGLLARLVSRWMSSPQPDHRR